MKSKISIWDCRRAIEIAGGLPLAIRGDLFAEPGPDPVARWISETVHVTQLEVKQGRWVIGNIGFTRHGQEHLTKLARDIIADGPPHEPICVRSSSQMSPKCSGSSSRGAYRARPLREVVALVSIVRPLQRLEIGK